jgi:hypothetical protein
MPTLKNPGALGKRRDRRDGFAAPTWAGAGAGFCSADRSNSTLFKLIVDIHNTVEVCPVAW